jgi:hypothetical protein
MKMTTRIFAILALISCCSASLLAQDTTITIRASGR